MSRFVKKGHKFIHLGLLQIAVIPLFRHGIGAKLLLGSFDLRHTKSVTDCIISAMETSLHDGPVFHNVFPNFSVSLTDPNINQVLKICLKTQGIHMLSGSHSLALQYRVMYRTTNTLTPAVKNGRLVGQTIVMHSSPNSNQITHEVIEWDKVSFPENWLINIDTERKSLSRSLSSQKNVRELSSTSARLSFSSRTPEQIYSSSHYTAHKDDSPPSSPTTLKKAHVHPDSLIRTFFSQMPASPPTAVHENSNFVPNIHSPSLRSKSTNPRYHLPIPEVGISANPRRHVHYTQPATEVDWTGLINPNSSSKDEWYTTPKFGHKGYREGQFPVYNTFDKWSTDEAKRSQHLYSYIGDKSTPQEPEVQLMNWSNLNAKCQNKALMSIEERQRKVEEILQQLDRKIPYLSPVESVMSNRPLDLSKHVSTKDLDSYITSPQNQQAIWDLCTRKERSEKKKNHEESNVIECFDGLNIFDDDTIQEEQSLNNLQTQYYKIDGTSSDQEIREVLHSMFGWYATQIESLHKDPVDVTRLITNGFIDLEKVKEMNYQLFLSTKLKRLEDIDKHWILMSTYYYNSGRINHTVMKDIFISSFPPVLARIARTHIFNVDHISLRNIFDQIKAIGKSECDRKKLQQEIANSKLYNSKVCSQLGVTGISTPKPHVCHCTKSSGKHPNSSKSKPWHPFRKSKSTPKRHRRFLRRSKTPKCYICQGPHYSNKCPQKSTLKPKQKLRYNTLSHDIKKLSLSYVSDSSSQDGDIELFTSSDEDEESPELNVIYYEKDDCSDSSSQSIEFEFNMFTSTKRSYRLDHQTLQSQLSNLQQQLLLTPAYLYSQRTALRQQIATIESQLQQHSSTQSDYPATCSSNSHVLPPTTSTNFSASQKSPSSQHKPGDRLLRIKMIREQLKLLHEELEQLELEELTTNTPHSVNTSHASLNATSTLYFVTLPFKFLGIKQYTLDALFDTGADSSVAKFNCFPKDLWKPTDITLSFGNGQSHQCKWMATVPITLQGKTYELEFTNYDGLKYDCVLGKRGLKQFFPIMIEKDSLTLCTNSSSELKLPLKTSWERKVNLIEEQGFDNIQQGIQDIVSKIRTDYCTENLVEMFNKSKLECSIDIQEGSYSISKDLLQECYQGTNTSQKDNLLQINNQRKDDIFIHYNTTSKALLSQSIKDKEGKDQSQEGISKSSVKDSLKDNKIGQEFMVQRTDLPSDTKQYPSTSCEKEYVEQTYDTVIDSHKDLFPSGKNKELMNTDEVLQYFQPPEDSFYCNEYLFNQDSINENSLYKDEKEKACCLTSPSQNTDDQEFINQVLVPSAVYISLQILTKDGWKPFEAMIDTGATINMSPSSLFSNWLKIEPVPIMTFNNSSQLTNVVLNDPILIGQQSLTTSFFASPMPKSLIILSMPFLDSIGPILICEKTVHLFPNQKLNIIPRIDPYLSARCQCHMEYMLNSRRDTGEVIVKRIRNKEERFLQRENSHGRTGNIILKRITDLPENCYDSGGILFSSTSLMALYRKDSFITTLISAYKIYLFSIWTTSCALMRRLSNKLCSLYEDLHELQEWDDETERETIIGLCFKDMFFSPNTETLKWEKEQILQKKGISSDGISPLYLQNLNFKKRWSSFFLDKYDEDMLISTSLHLTIKKLRWIIHATPITCSLCESSKFILKECPYHPYPLTRTNCENYKDPILDNLFHKEADPFEHNAESATTSKNSSGQSHEEYIQDDDSQISRDDNYIPLSSNPCSPTQEELLRMFTGFTTAEEWYKSKSEDPWFQEKSKFSKR
eukprot:Gb_05161 [translate_table: standard]